jgi:hypothetical protein
VNNKKFLDKEHKKQKIKYLQKNNKMMKKVMMKMVVNKLMMVKLKKNKKFKKINHKKIIRIQMILK